MWDKTEIKHFAWNNRYFILVLFQFYFKLCEPLKVVILHDVVSQLSFATFLLFIIVLFMSQYIIKLVTLVILLINLLF